MSPTLPLLSPRDLAETLAWHRGAAVSAAQFIGEAQLLAEALPAAGRPINLCQDRYHFALGLAAALLRGQTSLMPPNALTETLQQVPAGPTPYLLIDLMPPGGSGGLPCVQVQRPQHARPAAQVPEIAGDLEAVCLLTSGSTGAPQPHAKRWGPLVANIQAEAQRLAQMLDRSSLHGLTLVATVPAQHSYGLESSVLLALLGGAVFDSGRPFYPADIVSALAAVPQPRALVTTPFHLKTLLLAGVGLPPVALLLSATAPLSPQLAAQAEAATGGRLVEIYGCTEAGQVASRRTTEGDTWTTLGELRIHAVGESFVVSGGHVTEPTALADVLELQGPPDDSTRAAGPPDAGHPEGTRFRLLGRANDLIHVAGKRSSLAHLNFHLNRIEGVVDGAFWLPEEDGEDVVRPVVLVVAPRLGAREVIAGLRRQLEPAFVPRRVLHVAALPREATGKLTAGALRSFAEQVMADPVLMISADHPALAGHFPGRPLLPGVVLLSLVTQALHGRLGATPCIVSAKFLAPVGPGAQLRLALREGPGADAVAFEIWLGPQLAARGQLARDDA